MLTPTMKGGIAEMAIAAYCPASERCYYVPVERVDGRRVLHLRLEPARNNQVERVNYAVRYELGAIAQLGERVAGSHEVGGSSPPGSTPLKAVE